MGRKDYRHLSLEEREHVSLGLVQGKSLRSLARELDRSPSTLSREVRRNRGRREYRAAIAHPKARVRAQIPRRPRKLVDPWLWGYVERHLHQQWSPRQIALSLKRAYPGEVSKQVSHETIYATIYAYPRGEIKRDLLKELRQAHKYRRSRRQGKDRRGQIPHMVSIHDRPAEVEDRKIPGHWEGDLVKGTNQKAAIGTLVERTTRLTLLVKLNGLTADDARRAFARKLRGVPAVFRKSLTYDQGKEMSNHQQLAKQLKIDIYFCDPRSPWQRATCENTNGLLRQYFPRGMDLVPVTQRQLNFVERRLNNRPREGLDGATPYEAWDELYQSVASET